MKFTARKSTRPCFASGALGKGVAIEPTEGKLYAPADGEITTLFPTGHAVGLTTTEGVELLMHIGMDTVELDGKGFELSVKQGDSVKKEICWLLLILLPLKKLVIQ